MYLDWIHFTLGAIIVVLLFKQTILNQLCKRFNVPYLCEPEIENPPFPKAPDDTDG